LSTLGVCFLSLMDFSDSFKDVNETKLLCQ